MGDVLVRLEIYDFCFSTNALFFTMHCVADLLGKCISLFLVKLLSDNVLFLYRCDTYYVRLQIFIIRDAST